MDLRKDTKKRCVFKEVGLRAQDMLTIIDIIDLYEHIILAHLHFDNE